MDRRTFLKSTGAAAAATAAATSAGAREKAPGAAPEASPAAPAILTGSRRLSVMAAPVARIGEGAHAALRGLARALSLVTDGRIGLDIIEQDRGVELVQRGEADAYLGVEGDDLDQRPALLAFTGLPAALDDTPGLYRPWLAAGGGQDVWDTIAAGYGIKPLLAGQIETILWATDQPTELRPVLSHLRQGARGFDRILGETADATMSVDTLMFAITPCSPGAVMATLASGATPDLRQAFTGWSSPLHLTLGIRRSLWDDLPAADRLLIEALVAAEGARLEAERTAEQMAVREIMQARGARLLSGPPPSLRFAWQTAALVARTRILQNEPEAQRAFASYTAFRSLEDWHHAAGDV